MNDPRPHRHSRWRPTTEPGRWANVCLIAFLVGVVLDLLGLRVPIVAFLFEVSGIGALVLAIVGARQGDRSIPVLAAIAMGSLVVIFVIGEVLLPH